MLSELWEIVRANKLKAGETIIPLGEGGMDKGMVERVDDHGNAFYEREGFSGCVLGSQGRALRRYSGPSPEVLMLALEVSLMMLPILGDDYMLPTPDDLVKLAEAEIEAETKGGAK